MEITYSLRAECTGDVNRFVKAVAEHGFDSKIVLNERYAGVPDNSVEFTSNASLEELRNVIRTIDDSYVMLQTMRQCPLLDNSTERDFDVKEVND